MADCESMNEACGPNMTIAFTQHYKSDEINMFSYFCSCVYTEVQL